MSFYTIFVLDTPNFAVFVGAFVFVDEKGNLCRMKRTAPFEDLSLAFLVC